MDTQTIEKQKMDSLKSLAETNIEVSKAKELLFNFRKEESVYLEEREAKTLALVQKIMDESQEVLKGAFKNYEEIQSLSRESSQFATFLTELYADFTELRTLFEEKTAEWEKSVKETEKQLEEVKKQIKIDQVQIKNDRESIAREKVLLKQEKRKMADERETLVRAINRLKNNKI